MSSINASLNCEKMTEIDDKNALISEARAQKVSALVCAGLADGTELRKDYIANVYAFYRLIAVQGELTELLAARGILPVILKGTVCGAAYPRPELRAYGDIDFRVAPGRFDEALEILTQNGFRVTEEIHEYTRHVNLEKGGVLLEFHRYWCGSDSWEAPANGSEFNDRVMNAEAVPAEIMGKSASICCPPSKTDWWSNAQQASLLECGCYCSSNFLV